MGMNDSAQLGSAAPLVSLRGVNKSFGAQQVLFGVDLDVAAGEVVALLGTNGAGKSTMLKAVAGLISAGAGRTYFDGADITALSPQQRVAAGLALVPAKAIFPSLSVAENFRIAGWLGRRDTAGIEQARQRVFDLFPGLADRTSQVAGTMSGGQQQMLSLAMALLTRPRLLLIDELSLGLAPAVVGRLLDAVRELVADGMTVVIVEQSVNVALEVAERAVFLERGAVRFSGATADLLERDDVLRSVFIAGALPADTANPPAARRKPARKRKDETAAVAMDLMAQPSVLECHGIA
jgi:branched-chain amino acid transport system ATP-binding protein